MTSKEMAKLACLALEDKKAEDITIIDISGVSVLADYFIIANGSNSVMYWHWHSIHNSFETFVIEKVLHIAQQREDAFYYCKIFLFFKNI